LSVSKEADMAEPRDDQNKPDPKGKQSTEMPPAGPHARPDLTDNEKTPGTGSLPDDTGKNGDVGPD
jgi:hypothetical protein